MTTNLLDTINELPLEELIALRDKMDERITRVRRTEQTAAKKKIMEMANAYGIEVSFAQTPVIAKSKKPAKYQNPENADQTWTGVGKKPSWLESLISKGHKVEEFEIKSA